jgi:hypothetical protein
MLRLFIDRTITEYKIDKNEKQIRHRKAIRFLNENKLPKTKISSSQEIKLRVKTAYYYYYYYYYYYQLTVIVVFGITCITREDLYHIYRRTSIIPQNQLML